MGSGREARQLFTSAIKAAASRLAEKEEIDAILDKELSILKIEDIAFAIEEAKSMHRSKSGKQFKIGYC